MGITLRRVAFLIFISAFLISFSSEAGAQVYITGEQPVILQFEQFTGSGLSPDPSSGQLDSDTWILTGLSDGDLSYGEVQTENSFARGYSRGGVTEGGIYAFEVTSNNMALGLQPSNSDLTPGTLTLRVVNDTGTDLNGLSLKFDQYELNDGNRENEISFAYSIGQSEEDHTIPELQYRTLKEADANPYWRVTAQSAVLPVNIPRGATLYLKWKFDDIAGFGEGRDELALDNIAIEPLEHRSESMIRSGDLVITEIMASPVAGENQLAEYIEVYNRTNRPVDLDGFTVENHAGDVHRISGSGGQTVIAPYDFLVLGNNGRFSEDGSYQPDYFYGSIMSLGGNGAKTIKLRSGSEVIAEASYTSISEGRAIELTRIKAGHDGVTIPDDYKSVNSEDTFGNGRLGSPGVKGTNQMLSYGIRLEEEGGGWKMISLPLQNADVNQLADDLPGLQEPGRSFGEDKVFYSSYDGNRFTSLSDLYESLPAGNGIMIYTGEDSEVDNSRSDMIDLSGSVVESDITVKLHDSGDRWNLVGNPFTGPIDISELQPQNGALNSRVGQFWDDTLSSFVLTSTTGNRVPSWKGFFVQNNNARVLNIPVTSLKPSEGDDYVPSGNGNIRRMISFELKGYDGATERQATDIATALVFSDEAEHGWDQQDAEKLMPLPKSQNAPYYSSLLYFDGTHNGRPVAKAQESRPYELDGRIVLNMGLKTIGISGDFELHSMLDNIPDQWSVTLVDNQTGEEIDLSEQAVYRFRENGTSGLENEGNEYFQAGVSVDNNPDEQRFRLIVRKETLGHVENERDRESVTLNPNYPNPFNPTTIVSFELSEQTPVKLTVHTVIGQKVATLVDETLEAGTHTETWDASDMPSGIYILQLVVGGREFTRKMTLIK